MHNSYLEQELKVVLIGKKMHCETILQFYEWPFQIFVPMAPAKDIKGHAPMKLCGPHGHCFVLCIALNVIAHILEMSVFFRFKIFISILTSCLI